MGRIVTYKGETKGKRRRRRTPISKRAGRSAGRFAKAFWDALGLKKQTGGGGMGGGGGSSPSRPAAAGPGARSAGKASEARPFEPHGGWRSRGDELPRTGRWDDSLTNDEDELEDEDGQAADVEGDELDAEDPSSAAGGAV